MPARIALLAVVLSLIGGAAQAVDPRLQVFREEADRLRPLFTPRPKTNWIEKHSEERGQTFDQYLMGRTNRPTAKRTTLYLQPLGDFTADQDKAVGATVEYLHAFYGLPVKRLPLVPLNDVPPWA